MRISQLPSSCALATAAIAGLILAACSDAAPVAPKPSFAKARSSINLAVTIDDNGPSGAYHVRSDGGGEYVNGVNGISAMIDGFGNLEFTRPSTAASTRTVTFDWSAPVDPNNTYRPDESAQTFFKMLTNKVEAGGVYIQDLGVNGNPSSLCYGGNFANWSNGISDRDDWIPGTSNPPQQDIYITRTSISPDTWVMVSNGPCGGTPDVVGLSTEVLNTHPTSPMVPRGKYNLSFSIHLRAIP